MPNITLIVGQDPAERESYTWFTSAWKQTLLKIDPMIKVDIFPYIGEWSSVEFACVWKHPLGLLRQFPNLKCIASLAAGVDFIFQDGESLPQVPIVRIMDDYMAKDIIQYVVAYVLNDIKRIEHWATQQKQKTWAKQPPFNFSEKTIGVMGLGFLGGQTVQTLKSLGLNTIGYSLSEKSIPGVPTFVGEQGLNQFLSETDILVCMLPLTEMTRGILNHTVFSKLPQGAYLINVGRGDHLAEADLIQALESGQLSRACLDVFSFEPLPVSHPFWSHPQIQITPHIASVTNALTAAPQLLNNFRNLQQGKTLANVVNRAKGY